MIGKAMRSLLGIAAAALAGCGEGPPSALPGMETPEVLATVVPDVEVRKELASGSTPSTPLVDNQPFLVVSLISESLQIREICRNRDDCHWRQRCGRVRVQLANPSDQAIEIVRVRRERISPRGEVEAEQTLEVPAGAVIVPAQETRAYPPPQPCVCAGEDRFCTPEYPHLASPFWWRRTERIQVDFRSAGGSEGSAAATGTYVFLREER